MDRIDETDPRRMTLHDQRAGPDTVAEEADAFHQRPVRHPGGGEDDVLAAREILRAVHFLEIGNAHRAAAPPRAPASSPSTGRRSRRSGSAWPRPSTRLR